MPRDSPGACSPEYCRVPFLDNNICNTLHCAGRDANRITTHCDGHSCIIVLRSRILGNKTVTQPSNVQNPAKDVDLGEPYPSPRPCIVGDEDCLSPYSTKGNYAWDSYSSLSPYKGTVAPSTTSVTTQVAPSTLGAPLAPLTMIRPPLVYAKTASSWLHRLSYCIGLS